MMLLKFAFSSVYFSFFIWTLRITLTVVLPWRYWEWKITYLQWFQDTKKKLSARINGLDKNLEECAAITESTREDVSKDFLCLILSSSLFNNRISPVADICNSTESRYNKWRFEVFSCCSPCSGKSIATIQLFL